MGKPLFRERCPNRCGNLGKPLLAKTWFSDACKTCEDRGYVLRDPNQMYGPTPQAGHICHDLSDIAERNKTDMVNRICDECTICTGTGNTKRSWKISSKYKPCAQDNKYFCHYCDGTGYKGRDVYDVRRRAVVKIAPYYVMTIKTPLLALFQEERTREERFYQAHNPAYGKTRSQAYKGAWRNIDEPDSSACDRQKLYDLITEGKLIPLV